MTGSLTHLHIHYLVLPVDISETARTAFDKGAAAWREYLSTPLGRLRREISLYYLAEHVDGLGSGSKVLDAGGGTGSYAVSLAERGCRVCLLDLSPEMLAVAEDRIGSGAALLMELVDLRQGNVEDISDLFPDGYFDLILCHTVLEYVADPLQVARQLTGALRRGGMISIVLTNPHADALRAALAQQDLERARSALEGSISSADLFGLARRTVGVERVVQTLSPLGMVEVADYGVRVVADYLPAEKLAGAEFYCDLLELEKALGRLHPYKLIARYRQLLMRKIEPG